MKAAAFLRVATYLVDNDNELMTLGDLVEMNMQYGVHELPHTE